MGNFSVAHMETGIRTKNNRIWKMNFSEDFDEKLLVHENIDNKLTNIAEGSFSKVYSFMDNYAIKIMKHNHCKYLDNISEIIILNNLKSNYIVKSYGSFIINDSLSLIMENIPTNLNNYVFNNNEDKIDIIKQLCEGLKHLHDNFFLHLDFTPNNILIKTENNRPKAFICDFSHSCKTFDLTVTSISHRIAPLYRPYENLKGSLIYSNKSDIWSLGIIIYELINDIKLEMNLMNIMVDFEYESEMSLIIFIERLIAWKKWPLKLKIGDLDYSNFLDINIENRKINDSIITKKEEQYFSVYTFNISSLVKIESAYLYQQKTEELYIKIINYYSVEKLKSTFKTDVNLYKFCFIVIYSSYNFPDLVLPIFDSTHISFMLKMISDPKFNFTC